MSKRNKFILVGRTSEEIARGIVNQFGQGESTPDGKPAITKPGHVIQFEVSSFEDGEVNALIFANGDTPSHPIRQTLSNDDKKKIAKNLEDARITVVHSMSGQNTSIRAQGLTFLVRTLRTDYGVKSVDVISPALPYMRSDRNFSKDAQGLLTYEYNAVACREFAHQLKDSGVRRVWGFEPHSRDGVEHYRDVFGKQSSFVNMGYFFAEAIAKEFPLVSPAHECLVIAGSPDGMNKLNDYGIARASSFGEALYLATDFSASSKRKDFRERPYMFGIHKERISPKETRIVDFHGDVAGKVCIIIDDIISGGSTTLHAAEELKKRGAIMVIGIATHGVLVNGALQKLIGSPHLDRIMLTDTIPGVLDKLEESQLNGHGKLVVASVSPLVNKVIERNLKL